MSLFDLSLEEDKSMVTSGVEGDYEEPEEIHPEAAGAEGEQIEHLSRVLNTIDSLESARVTYMNMKQNETEYSAESMRTINQVLSERISLAYQMNGLKEEFPVHISTESFATLHGSRNAITLALEELDGRIAALSTEANHFLARFWRNTKEFFGDEFQRIERVKDTIKSMIKDVEKGNIVSDKTVTVRNPKAITIGGNLAIEKVISNIEEGVKRYFGNGKIMNEYFSNLQKSCEFYKTLDWTDEKAVEAAVSRKNFFTLGAPFRETSEKSDRFNYYEWEVSDLNGMSIPMPKGNASLIPSTPYSTNHGSHMGSGFKGKVRNTEPRNLPVMDKNKLLKALNDLLDCLDSLPNTEQLTGLSRNMKKDIKRLTERNISLAAKQNSKKEWDSDNWKELVGSLVVPIGVLATTGFAGVGAYIMKQAGDINMLASAVSGNNDPNSSIYLNDAMNNGHDNKYIQGFRQGFANTVFKGLVLKQINESFENKVTLFFIGLYRELYALVKSTANGLLSYSYSCIGKSNKI